MITDSPDLVGQSAGGHAAQGAGGVGGLLAVIGTPAAGGVPRTLLPLADHLGTTHLLLNPATGATTRFRYAPFGEPLARDASTAADADPDGVFGHLYSTKPWNVDTGLYYYGYRYYHPRSGRWISRDPIAEDGGLNLFGFCSNDPLNCYDLIGAIPGDVLAGQYAAKAPQWHHLLPKEIFGSSKEAKAYRKSMGITFKSMGIDGKFLHQAENGWLLTRADHIGDVASGVKGVHPEWNKVWKDWIKAEVDAGRKITKSSIIKKRDDMMGGKAFSKILNRGQKVNVPYTSRFWRFTWKNLLGASKELAEKGVDVSAVVGPDSLRTVRQASAAAHKVTKGSMIVGTAKRTAGAVGSKIPLVSIFFIAIAYNSPQAKAMETEAGRRLYAVSSVVGADLAHDFMNKVGDDFWTQAEGLSSAITKHSAMPAVNLMLELEKGDAADLPTGGSPAYLKAQSDFLKQPSPSAYGAYGIWMKEFGED